jgi:selenocysteine-specific elongation factor
MPEKYKAKEGYLQFTLVDCPGHGSLLKTIIGGAQIIDVMLLVVDIVKGIQTQTAECIIIAELFVDKLIVVLNKKDMLEDQKQVETKTAALRKVFAKTKFGHDVLMLPISTKENVFENVSRMKQAVIDNLEELPERKKVNKNFMLMIDHCFKIKGKGNIVTGTVIEGRIKIGD